jgi:hypothetical protein
MMVLKGAEFERRRDPEFDAGVHPRSSARS